MYPNKKKTPPIHVRFEFATSSYQITGKRATDCPRELIIILRNSIKYDFNFILSKGG